MPHVIERMGIPRYSNPSREYEMGAYRSHNLFNNITSDLEVIEIFIKN